MGQVDQEAETSGSSSKPAGAGVGQKLSSQSFSRAPPNEPRQNPSKTDNIYTTFLQPSASPRAAPPTGPTGNDASQRHQLCPFSTHCGHWLNPSFSPSCRKKASSSKLRKAATEQGAGSLSTDRMGCSHTQKRPGWPWARMAAALMGIGRTAASGVCSTRLMEPRTMRWQLCLGCLTLAAGASVRYPPLADIRPRRHSSPHGRHQCRPARPTPAGSG